MKFLILVLGVSSILIFIFEFLFLEGIRPRMIIFDEITSHEDSQLTWVGMGLLVILIYYFISLWQTVRYLRYAEEITFSYVLLLVIGVVAFLFVLSDVALLQDIVKQYKAGLAQPEWSLVYPIMGFQAIVALIFTWLHITGSFSGMQVNKVAKDSNVFMVVQYVGIICGAAGLVSNMLGFLCPRSWNPMIHSVIGSLILIFPYGLTIIYWFIIKVNEKDQRLYDEKQMLDVGRSSFLTMIICSVLMLILYSTNFQNLEGITSVLWFPLFMFTEILLFSLGNIYYSNKPLAQ
jgi:hypothetical protein